MQALERLGLKLVEHWVYRDYRGCCCTECELEAAGITGVATSSRACSIGEIFACSQLLQICTQNYITMGDVTVPNGSVHVSVVWMFSAAWHNFAGPTARPVSL